MSVFKRILNGYRSILGGISRFILLLGFCTLTGFIVSYPAWKLAETKPRLFTAVFLTAAAAVILFFLFRHFLLSWRTNPRLFILKTAGILTLLAGFTLFVWQTYSRRPVLACVLLVVSVIAYGIIRFGLSGIKSDTEAEAFPEEKSV